MGEKEKDANSGCYRVKFFTYNDAGEVKKGSSEFFVLPTAVVQLSSTINAYHKSQHIFREKPNIYEFSGRQYALGDFIVRSGSMRNNQRETPFLVLDVEYSPCSVVAALPRLESHTPGYARMGGLHAPFSPAHRMACELASALDDRIADYVARHDPVWVEAERLRLGNAYGEEHVAATYAGVCALISRG